METIYIFKIVNPVSIKNNFSLYALYIWIGREADTASKLIIDPRIKASVILPVPDILVIIQIINVKTAEDNIPVISFSGPGGPSTDCPVIPDQAFPNTKGMYQIKEITTIITVVQQTAT
jgi:hypothetical protein